MDESTIDIQFWFIHGSDALGCKVVLVSDYSNINNTQVHLSKNDTSASGQLSLTHNISCYQRVFAFDIDVSNTISNLAIEGNIAAKATADCVYMVDSKLDHRFSLQCMCIMITYMHICFVTQCSQVRRSFL